MVNTPVLKIESEDKILLVSRNAKQEVCPVSKESIIRNINSELIKTNHKTKFKTVVETKDDVNAKALNQSEKFKIYSIIRFMQPSSEPLHDNFIEDSVERNDEVITYRPIFEMMLTNFSCKSEIDNGQIWRLEFEEI